jgi:arginine exporter protein ArgO
MTYLFHLLVKCGRHTIQSVQSSQERRCFGSGGASGSWWFLLLLLLFFLVVRNVQKGSMLFRMTSMTVSVVVFGTVVDPVLLIGGR